MLQVPGNSPAAKAGIQPTTRGFAGNIVLGDVIVAVDNKPVRFFTRQSLFLLVHSSGPYFFYLIDVGYPIRASPPHSLQPPPPKTPQYAHTRGSLSTSSGWILEAY